MISHSKTNRAFTLVELLVTIFVIGILASLLLPVLGNAKEKARRSECGNNLKQINLSIRLYADDNSDSLPVLPTPNPYPNGVGAYYKQLVKGYVGLNGPASPGEKVFTCPSDQIIRTQFAHAFTSYTFNGYEVGPGDIPRITGNKLNLIKNPTKGVLVGEFPGFAGGAWHPRVTAQQSNAKAVMSFADAHVAFVKIYWDGIVGSQPRRYEPPAGYDYNWDGE